MSLNYHEIFEAMADTPQVDESTEEAGHEFAEALALRWPRAEEIGDHQKAFLDGDPEQVIQVTKSTISNRPTRVVTVRHPGAVAAQAKYGFVTKAMKDVS